MGPDDSVAVDTSSRRVVLVGLTLVTFAVIVGISIAGDTDTLKPGSPTAKPAVTTRPCPPERTDLARVFILTDVSTGAESAEALAVFSSDGPDTYLFVFDDGIKHTGSRLNRVHRTYLWNRNRKREHWFDMYAMRDGVAADCRTQHVTFEV